MKKEQFCLRCGMDKKELRKKGYYMTCSGWGKNYGRHLFKKRDKKPNPKMKTLTKKTITRAVKDANKEQRELMKTSTDKINQLATEITYAQDKGVDITLDDWIKKIEDLLRAQKKELDERLEKMREPDPKVILEKDERNNEKLLLAMETIREKWLIKENTLKEVKQLLKEI